jgi:peptidoglycan/xylan/chitin deacetylase (PgdA/CDA1 family)
MKAAIRASPAALLAVTACVALAACGGSGAPRPATAETPLGAPAVKLTTDEKRAWKLLPPDRSAIPVLLYHGIGPASDFSNADDASYGIGVDDFAKQMTMIARAGYQTISLKTFNDFVQGKPVELPPRPLLLTFDDARADSWTGADGILRKLHFNAVMFVDVGRVDAGDPEYLTWQRLQKLQGSGRWELQLHSGKGHVQIHYGPDDNDYGPFYAYEQPGEDLPAWRTRVRSDLTWGQQTLSDHVPAYEPLAFAPPFGDYGQDGSNDPRIAGDLLSWLTGRYRAVFTQDRNARAKPGDQPPFGRIQVTRGTAGGDLYGSLLSGDSVVASS